ncbi:MAG: isoprenylcysteine carboxylmethyltransferase family protein [Anaerolineae bacterium]|nr:isoprenylcysteine carboxylmethyltransferase family protein [Phycisphaerae bacterium]
MIDSWPALCIALTVGAYWSRVLRLVYKSYKQTGHNAGFWPAESLGRALRFLWFPAITLWFVIPLLVAFGATPLLGMRYLWLIPMLEWLGVLIAAAAFGATLVCWKKMGKSWRMGIDPGEKTQLVFTGPYAYVRHPIYALSSLLMLASMIAVPAPAMLIIGVIHLIFLQWEARREERYLVGAHGDDYAQYLRRVGRFVPRSLGGYHGAA